MSVGEAQVFALNATHAFGERVADLLGAALSPIEEREFDDGEHKTRPLVSVRNRDVYVIQSLHGDTAASPNDKLCRLLFFLGTLRDNGAARITAILPYLAYSRKDVRSQPRDPVTTRYVAALFEAMQVDRVVSLDVHNLTAFQNAFRCHTEHLDTTALFARYFSERISKNAHIAVVSPDVGGVKRAERLRQALGRLRGQDLPLAFLSKTRAKGVVKAGPLVGDVAGHDAIIVDDIIGTGTTLAFAAQACRAGGARKVYAAATHGFFFSPANELLSTDALDAIVVTDSVPPFRLPPGPAFAKLSVVSVAPLFAQAIQRLHGAGSLVELLAP